MSFDLDRIEEAAKAATPGPWRHGFADGSGVVVDPDRETFASGGWIVVANDKETTVVSGSHGTGVRKAPDAEFIALTDPASVLALVEVVRAAQNFIATYNNATTLTDTTDARIVLIAALKAFA